MRAQSVYRNPSVLIASRLGIVASVLTALFSVSATRGQTSILVLAVLWLGFSIRVGRAGIRVEPEGIKVVGMLTASPKIPWTAIDHFAAKPFGQYPAVARVVLKVGREYSCLAIASLTKISPGVGQSISGVERTVEELNVLAQERRTPAPTTDPTTLEGFLDRLK